MKYYFSDFILNTNKKELYCDNQVVALTKQSYSLLHYFLQHADKIHPKDELVEFVWKGRFVSDNTIDQSISKLKKVLNQHKANEYFETVYGQGTKFLIPVNLTPPTSKPRAKLYTLLIFSSAMIGLAFWFFNSKDSNVVKPKVVFLSEHENFPQLSYAIEEMLSQLVTYSGAANLIDYDKKPEHQDNQKYLALQEKISPGLTIVSSKTTKIDETYSVEINLKNNNDLKKVVINSPNLHTLLQKSINWVVTQIDQPLAQKQLARLLSKSDHFNELYLRGVNSLKKNEFEKALQQFELLLLEDPKHQLARYQSAYLHNINGNQNKALAHIETLMTLDLTPVLMIDVIAMKADILDTLGQHLEAIALLEGLLSEYQDQVTLPLYHIRFRLSHVLQNMNEYQQGFEHLNYITTHLSESEDVHLLADTYELKGRLMQKTGDLVAAKINAENALSLFERMENALGAAKTYTLLARIASHNANYSLATQYLEQSLSITEDLKYPLGEGATLNELIYVLMVQGQHNKAWKLNQRLEQIAIDIDYNAMLMASKQLFFDMAREQQKWLTAERYLSQHAELAKASQNQRGMINNQLLSLSLLLDQNKVDGVKALINSIQKHIDTNQESRLQPRIDSQLARFYFLSDRQSDGIAILNAAKEKASKTEDGETLIAINNLLAEQHLLSNQPEKALAALKESDPFNPFAIPHLILKAESYQQLKLKIEALETINLAKQNAADLWTEVHEVLKNQIMQEAQLQ